MVGGGDSALETPIALAAAGAARDALLPKEILAAKPETSRSPSEQTSASCIENAGATRPAFGASERQVVRIEPDPRRR